MFFDKIGNKAKTSDFERMYSSDASFVDMLPWVEYIDSDQQFIFNDGISRMAVLEIKAIPTEGRSQDNLESVSKSLARVIADSFDEEDHDPWTVQFFMSSEAALDHHLEAVRNQPNDLARGTEYTEEFLRLYEEHVKDVANPDGFFHDKAVSDSIWRARMVTIRMVVYRRYWKTKPRKNVSVELKLALDSVVTGLQSSGITATVVTGAEFYRWMLIWFNPRPPMFDGDPTKMVETLKYPDAEDSVVGNDIADMVVLERPSADRKKGVWYFDGLPHSVVQASKLDRRPEHGALSGEVLSSGKVFSLVDRLPVGCVVSMTVFILAQDTIKNRVKMIADRAIGDTAESGIARPEASAVLEKQARNDKLFPMEVAVYLRGDDETNLRREV